MDPTTAQAVAKAVEETAKTTAKGLVLSTTRAAISVAYSAT
jgi:hypothetical protein